MPRIADPHVHCRDGIQAYKATIESTTELARRSGVVAIIDMPNTDPPIIDAARVAERLKLAEDSGSINGYYLYVGATADKAQLAEAVWLVETNQKVAGMKLYAGKSVGDLEVSEPDAQKMVYETLARLRYRGVLVVHCEKESLFRMELWDPKTPMTWNLARPPEAEVESVKDQIRMARDSGLEAHIHIAHISVPQSVMVVDKARSAMRISCGATPHHLMLSTADMQGPAGLMHKVNPPLRSPAESDELVRLLREGKIDMVESDHAPHTQEEKMREPYMSGIPSLQLYPALMPYLSKRGFTDKRIEEITYNNVKRVFDKIVE